MTAIDRLLRQAGELNAASMKELSPALEEMASVQAGVADTLEPILEVMASIAGAQPFRYGFVLPAEPPELKPDQAEPAPAQGKAEVNLGPINVYAIAGEIQKALNSVGQDSANLQGAFSTYVPKPAALPPAAPQEGRHQPPTWPQSVKPERPYRAAAEPKPPQGTAVARKIAGEKWAEASTKQWVEDSIKRSGIVMKDLREAQENITSSTITEEKVRELSVDALSIGTAAAMGSAPPRLPEKPQKEEEPARPVFTYAPPVVIKPRAPAESLAPALQEARNTALPQLQSQPMEKPGTPGLAQTAPASEAGEPALPGTAKAPTIRLRASPVVAPAEDADFNARSLSKARFMEAESSRPQPEAGSRRRDKEEKPVKVEWPVITTGSADKPAVSPVQRGNAPGQTRPTEASTPVVQVIRSFGAMGEALRAVSQVGTAAGFSMPAAAVPPIMEAGAPILNAMAGTAPVSRPESGEIGRLAAAANTSRASSLAQPAASPVPKAESGGSPAVVFLPGTGAHASRPAWGLAANVSAAQASQRSGMAMVQRLIQAAPHVAGSIAPQATAIYDSGRGLPFPGMVTPAAASGAENIVNITVPQAAQSKVSETNTTTRVANFHNTFNITVNLQSAEERDLKELGKKIGQLLSEELKRYGGLS